MSHDHWNATDYNRQSSAQTQWARELSAKLALRGHEHLLDVGCGTGNITAQFAEQLASGSVVGIDSSADMIAFAAQHHRQPNLHFVHMDACAIDLDSTFDVVFSNAVLHWIVDHVQVLRGVRQHMQPGGKLLFQMGGQGNAQQIIAAVEETIDHPAWREYFIDFAFPYHFYGPAVYEQWLPQTGFRRERSELIPRDMQHDREGLRGWLRTTWFPYIQRVPADQQPVFIEQIIDTYLAHHPADEQGMIHVAMIRLEVAAVAC